MNYKKFLTTIIKELLGHKDFDVKQTKEPYQLLLSLYIYEDDMSKIIGRNGDISKSIRRLLNGVGEQNGDRVGLTILQKGIDIDWD